MKALLFLTAILGFLPAIAREKKTILHQNGRVQYEFETSGHLLDGKFACYYENGKLRIKGEFTSNQKTGIWRVWDERGLLRSERLYTNNYNFSIITECDSTGTRIYRTKQTENIICKPGEYLFSHHYLNSVSRMSAVNSELFAEDGLVHLMIEDLQKGSVPVFSDSKLTDVISTVSLQCYEAGDVVELLVKEEYSCCARDQVMVNKLIAVCPVIMENGVKKEIGWFYMPDITHRKDQVSKLRDRQYASTLLKTTVNDPAYRLRDVSGKERELLSLKLIEFEATAILYVMDQQLVAIN